MNNIVPLFINWRKWICVDCYDGVVESSTS